MATSLDTGVPWVMCQQADAPDPIVSFLLLASHQLKLLCNSYFTALAIFLIPE